MKTMANFFPHCAKFEQECTYTKTVFIVSDFRHVQDGNCVCSWQLRLVFLPGKVWKGDFLERITLGVFSWNVCLQEQKVGKWHAITCLANDQSSTEQYTTFWITRNYIDNKQWETKATRFVAETASFRKEHSSILAYFYEKLI